MNLKENISEISQFLSIDIWKTESEPGIKGLGLNALKVILITIKEFTKDQIALKSSAVTYLSILSVVPLAALAFGISKGFGLAINLQEEVAKLFPGQEVVMTSTFEFAQNMLDNAKGGIIAGVSMIVLIFTVMKLLNNIEDVFNSIWGKQRPRTWIRKFTDYLALIIVAPILIVLSSSATVFMETQMKSVGEQFDVEAVVNPLVVFLVSMSSYVLVWILYALIYVIMPNVKVNWKSGVLAGIVAGTIFHIVQWGFIYFSIGVANYNAIYGSFAAIPLFFIFTQISWTIFFVGGELSFAIQSVDHYIPDERDIQFSQKERKRIALLVTHAAVKAFENGDPPFSKQRFADELQIPHRFVSNAVNRLVKANVLTKSIEEGAKQHVYIPGIDINKIDIQFVINRLEDNGVNDLFTKDQGQYEDLLHSFDELQKTKSTVLANKLLKDIK